MKWILTIGFILFCTFLFAAEGDILRVRSLSDRGLFEAADVFCNEKFQQNELSETDKVLLAVELVHAKSQQLLLSAPAQRTKIIKRLESLEKTFLASEAQTLPKITLQLELAMAYLSLGNDQMLEAGIVSETKKKEAYQSARSVLLTSIERLKICSADIKNLQQRIGTNADSLLKQKITALEYTITMQRGIAQKDFALTFPTGDDRLFELRRTAETFSELAAIPSDEPVLIQCKLEKAACHRLCGELEQCRNILAALQNAALTPECRLQADAELIRYQIAAGNITEALKQFGAERADSKCYPDFDLARLELFLANDPAKNIKPSIDAAMKLLQTIERQSGQYWSRRANLILRTSPLGQSELNNAAVLAALAENQYREKQFTESAELYEQAAEKSEIQQDMENVFRFSRQAISAWGKALEQKTDGGEKSAIRKRLIIVLQKLAVQFPKHPESAELHLLAIDLSGQAVLAKQATVDDYLALLMEHTAMWSDSPKLQRIRRQSVILLEQQGRTAEAAAMLQMLDTEQLETLTPEIRRIRTRQLETEGKTQEAVDILTALLKQKNDEPATLQLLAAILTRQTDAKSWEYALSLWTLLEQKTPRNSEHWWAAREGIIEVLCKLDRKDEAKKSFDMLQILYPGLGGAERKERLTKRF